MSRVPSKLLYALLVFIAGASYGFIVPVVKTASINGLSVPDFLPSNYLIAFIICLIYLLVRRIKWAGPKTLLKLTCLGFFTASTSICYYGCLTLLPSAVALTLLFQYVWVGVIIECVIDKHLPSRSTVIACIIVLIGTLFAAGIFESSFTTLDPFGVALGCGSAVFYALLLFTMGRIGAHENAALRTTMLCAGGFLVSLVANPHYFTSSMLNAATWPYALILAFIGVIIPVGLIAIASPHLTTGAVNVTASSELPVGVLAAWALIGEVPSVLTMVGVVLVLAGIVYKQMPEITAARKRKMSEKMKL